MNPTIYRQYDSRWGSLPYPGKGSNLSNSGCGCFAVLHCAIELDKYKNLTPQECRKYMVQYATVKNGTLWSGITKGLQHYGYKVHWNQNDGMATIFKELENSCNKGVILFRDGTAPNGTEWTSSGHYVEFSDYRITKEGRHEFYCKDSGPRNHDGWHSYERSMKGCIRCVWICKSADDKPAPAPTPPAPVGKLTVDGVGGAKTVRRMQEFLNCAVVDGVIGGQLRKHESLFPALKSVSFGKGGSNCIYKLQEWLGLSGPDGYLGPNTTKAWQKKLRDLGYLEANESIDGVIGSKTMKAWQECLNNDGKKKVEPEPTPTPDPQPTPVQDKYKVIDVSEFQKKIDWAKVKADGVVGAIIRYGDGDYLDPNFDTNMKNAKANGLHIGAYIFSRAKTKAAAEKEATRLFNACKPYSPDLPLYIDLEAKGLEKYAETVAQAFIAKIKALGGKPGVYANLNWWNHYLTKTAKLSFAMWLAQYNKTMDYKPKSYVGMWQYTSSGKVNGISGRVDMDWLYQRYWDNDPKPTPEPTPPPAPTPDKQGYQGSFPSFRLTKSNAKVKSDACTWAKKIAANNDFHYGKKPESQHNGCFYCGTQPKSKQKAGIKMWQTTYCCNPFVGAAWAHGGGDAQAYKNCHNGTSWDFSKGKGYDASKLFDNLGHPAKSKLQAGDVLCRDNHVALYIGDGKIAEASGGDDNVIHSTKWNKSISVKTLTDANYKKFPRVHRYNSKVDCDRYIMYGEFSDRVADLQRFLLWYGYKISVTGFFNKSTLEAVIKFQEAELGKGQGDGSVGPKTIDAMKKVKK